MIASTDSQSALVDTNIVVYAYDLDDPWKHTVARELIEQLSNQGRLVWSTQVFNEFCSVMMRPKRKKTLAPDELAVILRELSATGEVIPITLTLTFRALDAMPRHSLSFWDALIWSAAVENRVPFIYSEDFQDGRAEEKSSLTSGLQLTTGQEKMISPCDRGSSARAVRYHRSPIVVIPELPATVEDDFRLSLGQLVQDERA
jgi:predicted nucleic acid-binding protein